MHSSTYILQTTTCISLPYVLRYDPSTEIDVGTMRVVAEGQGKIALGDAIECQAWLSATIFLLQIPP